jgi:ribosomal protein S18 acetylase RimI-like enzyme
MEVRESRKRTAGRGVLEGFGALPGQFAAGASPPYRCSHTHSTPAPLNVTIEASRDAADRQACARMMSTSEPWITLQRDYDRCLGVVSDPTRELYVAHAGTEVVGFIILNMAGQFPGYIQTVCVAESARGHGVGAQLVGYAEARINRVSPNVFLCVSSFNPGARRLYERLGYEFVGTLKNYLVEGYDELLYRKTVGPWNTFVPAAKPA